MSVSANNDEPLVRIAEDDFAKAVSLRAILAASLPSIVNNAAQPIAAALQLGLLGHTVPVPCSFACHDAPFFRLESWH